MFARRIDPVAVLTVLRNAPGTAASVGHALSLSAVETNEALRWGEQSGLLVRVAPETADPKGAAFEVTDRGRTFLDNRQRLEEGLRRAWPATGRPSGDDLVDAYAEWTRDQGPVPAGRLRALVGTAQRIRHVLAALAVLLLVGGLVLPLVR